MSQLAKREALDDGYYSTRQIVDMKHFSVPSKYFIGAEMAADHDLPRAAAPGAGDAAGASGDGRGEPVFHQGREEVTKKELDRLMARARNALDSAFLASSLDGHGVRNLIADLAARVLADNSKKE